MWLRALMAILLLPGLVGVVVPLLLKEVDPWRVVRLRPFFLLTLIGLVILVLCVRDFYVSGRGTLAPWDPPRRLVVAGLYRYQRNPMYVAVVMMILGGSLGAGSPLMFGYGIALAFLFHWRVKRFEEPDLLARFGDEWRTYANAVGRWWPRLTPWRQWVGTPEA